MRFKLIIMITFVCVIATKWKPQNEKVSSNTKKYLWQAEVYVNDKNQNSYINNPVDTSKKLNKLCDKIKIAPEDAEIFTQQKNEKTSQYKGVYWNKQIAKWVVLMRSKKGKAKYWGTFNDELDAGKRVNQLCEEFGIPLRNPTISAIPNEYYQPIEKVSQYKGVSYDKRHKKWYVRVKVNGQKQKYGGSFNDELDAAKKVNQLCEDFGIPQQNPTISAIPNEQNKEKTSQYKGVTWHSKIKKWYAQLPVKGGKTKYGGTFDNELEAAKRVNQLCEELSFPQQNPTVSAIPDEKYQKKEKTSKYKGVSWESKTGKWRVYFCVKGKSKFGGRFNDELDAGEKVNQLCEELKISLQNPAIRAIPNRQYQKTKISERLSQYKGVYWKKRDNKWHTIIQIEGNQKFGGAFSNQLDAVNGVNQLYEQFGITMKNNEMKTNLKPLQGSHGIQSEFESLIKMLDDNNDPTTSILKEILITTINNEEQTSMTEINFRTQNSESVLSIAAKHGFSNAVKFLISKGANKEHFTNEHHTPLSLAVSHNHLKVAQVLFEDWMSPNVHEKSYLHLSPIFNVKSREIAQLLIDNDAVTHDLYNEKHQSPLTVACENGYLDVVEFFLDDELDINHLDNDNKTPLFYALINKHHDVVNLLISKGAQN